jgi:hypothetical protein
MSLGLSAGTLAAILHPPRTWLREIGERYDWDGVASP